MNKIYVTLLYIISLCLKFTFSKSFLFSVIISIYNTGRYLNDSFGSIYNQTIGFNNIQIILVNDGSSDETEEICLNYKNKYPENVVYIKIEHSGVSVGRNIGLKHAKGEFINFLDADDKWDSEAFKLVFLFFRFHKNIDIIGCRLILFEAKNSPHPLDYKFYKSRIVNLIEEYNCIQLSSSSSFFRYSSIENEKFKEGIFNGEDTRFINNILLKKPIFGLIKEAIYYYRRRRDLTSAVQNSIKNDDYYFFVIKSVDEYLLNESKKFYNRILPFIQFLIAYNTLFRIDSPSFKYLDKSKFYSYCDSVEKILMQIDDKFILEQKILSLKLKLLVLSKKYKRDIRNDIILKKDYLMYFENELINLKRNKAILIWRFLEIRNNIIHLEGKDNFPVSPDTFFYYCKLGNKIIYPYYYDYSGYDLITMYGKENKGRIVVFDIPIENINNEAVNFFLSYKGQESEIFPSLGWFTHMPSILNGYYNSGKYIIRLIKRRIYIYKYDKRLETLFENDYCEQLKSINKSYLIKFRNNSIQYRNENQNKKFIWIINDKLFSAGDNGEYFFRFLKKKNPNNIEFYFVIKGDCNDFKRLHNLGNILEFGSEEHLEIFLKSDKILSSVFDNWADNPFNDDYKFIRDLIHFDLIYLQHGIIKDDLSNYLNKISKNYSLIITSSNQEYKSILKETYGYSKNNLILTGLPRYDGLKNLNENSIKQKVILIMPTWRSYIKGTFDSLTYESLYSKAFNLTLFFNFYNNLLNNDELIVNMEKYNYFGIFCLHPYFSKQWIDFKSNKIFSVLDRCDYQNLLLNSSLLITDYSSIFFDFAYLKKPIIYSQFDYKEYRFNQFPESYFSYKKHGYGPVCYNLNCTIKNIILQLKKGCIMEQKYLKRIKKFFEYTDTNNCQRIYLALLNNSYLDNCGNKYSIIFIIIFLISVKLFK